MHTCDGHVVCTHEGTASYDGYVCTHVMVMLCAHMRVLLHMMCTHEGTASYDGHVVYTHEGTASYDGHVVCTHEGTASYDGHVVCTHEGTTTHACYTQSYHACVNDMYTL